MATSESLRRTVTDVRVVAIHDGVRSARPDAVATEEPMEIRVGGPGQRARAVAVTMRTPGADFELAVGFLFTEGLIVPGDVRRVAYCDDLGEDEQRYNVVTVSLDRGFDHDRLRRNFFATSSCGICGKAALDDVEVRCAPVADGSTVSAEVLVSLPETL
ncbi:MAG TPA: formate dehydrogenase accessory sulfurtransferase FdhD, partial [Actinomycetota bacterium]|nr:formate dehydrogenase accessory sulfurtransferase FdhD [Actinomycetota bacterium]